MSEVGWTLEEAEKVSKYRGDCIPFPEGSYKIRVAKSPIEGKGIFATAEIQEGEIIAPTRISGSRTPAGYMTNHSKTPNAITVASGENRFLIATRNIKGKLAGGLGEEITIDYRLSMKANGLIKENKNVG
jgi:hypothetical protein